MMTEMDSGEVGSGGGGDGRGESNSARSGG